MELFTKLANVLERVPAVIPLIVLPALCVAAVALFGFLGGRKIYPAVAVVLLGLGFTMICAYDAGLGGVYFGLFLAWAALWGCLLFLPKLKKRARKKESKTERMYAKFHQELTLPEPVDKKPPKVCCFEESPEPEQTEAAPQLDHADALLQKLASAKLSPGDRLEADSLKRKLDLYRNRPLTKAEHRTLNDCLSTVLKLTAKYKL